jgi:hypothetical protein
LFVIDAGKFFGPPPPPGETGLQNGDSTAKGVLDTETCEGVTFFLNCSVYRRPENSMLSVHRRGSARSAGSNRIGVSSLLLKPTFLKKESEAYEITSLSVCPPLITFEPIGRFL